MKMIDIVIGNIKCERCGMKHSFSYKSSDFECLFKEYKLGDMVSNKDNNCIKEFQYHCSKTNKDFTGICMIQNGILVGFFNKDDYEKIKGASILNINSQVYRYTNYLNDCESGYGFEENLNESIAKCKNIGDTINALNRDWTILNVLKEKLIKSDSIEYNIARERFEDNIVYLVEDKEMNLRLIRITSSYKYVANSNIRKLYNEKDYNDYMLQDFCKFIKIK